MVEQSSGGCTNDSNIECFFQMLDIHHGVIPFTNNDVKTQSIFFSLNHAHVSGSTLYGGLLDRCAVSRFAEAYVNYYAFYGSKGVGFVYFKSISIPHYFNLAHKEAGIKFINILSSDSSVPLRQ